MSSTDGSPTNTCWNRRSSAASFSMYLRNSSSVVAPIMRSSPRASIGLIMLPASTAPSAPPAPTIVCSSSMNVTTSPSESDDLLEDGLEPLLELAAVLRARDHRADVEGDEPLVAQALGNVALDDAARQTFGDRGLAHAGLTDEHRVVLRAPRQHLDDPTDLLVAADHRIELALARLLGEVTSVALQRLVLLLGILRGDSMRTAHLLQRVEHRVGRHAEPAQEVTDAAGDLGHREQHVLGREVVVAEFGTLAVGGFEQSVSVGAETCGALGGVAVDLRQLVERGVDLVAHRLGRRPRPARGPAAPRPRAGRSGPRAGARRPPGCDGGRAQCLGRHRSPLGSCGSACWGQVPWFDRPRG